METRPTATEIKVENEAGTQYSAVILGKRWSGITAGSRLFASIEKAIADGASITPYPTPTLDELKDKAIQERDAKTRKEIAQGFTYRGSMFSMSDAAQRNWIAMGVGVALGLINADNLPKASTIEEVPFVFIDMADVGGFLGAYAQYLTSPLSPLGVGREAKALIKAATTEEELSAI